LQNCQVKAGFDPTDSSENYPDRITLDRLKSEGFSSTDIWNAVMVHSAIAEIFVEPNAAKNWSNKINWIKDNSEFVANTLREKNAALKNSNQSLIIAFDGLDRVALTWLDTVELIRGLLQAQLEFKKYSNIHTKAFIRPDLILDPGIRKFPDASKILSLAVKLEWASIDLYGLIWQYLANSDESEASAAFRAYSKTHAKFSWNSSAEDVFVLAEVDRNDEQKQRNLFHAIAGKTMGGRKSGDTWTWLPKHLADSHGYASPRSFLEALRSAAEYSIKKTLSGSELTLHPSSIKAGVSRASQVRRNELEENFPWIRETLSVLKGLSLPSGRQDITSRWKEHKTLDSIYSDKDNPVPDGIDESDPGSILLVLARMGLCRVLDDNRIDFPDIVRVDAGMTRKGGVPATK
jgi:hypothetical protein